MTNVTSAIASIMTIDNTSDLNAIIDAVKLKQKSLRKAKSVFIKSETAVGQRWNVPLTMLAKA